ncbi:MAG: DNA-directed RNA polymerase subunit D [archaeon]
MEIKAISKKDNQIKFLVSGINETIANSLRRSLQEVPILAIDTVEFSKNDSALYDEILALRIGLVVFKSEKLNLQEECDCNGKGCSKCTITFKLERKGPCTVYSSDLKGKADVVYEKMPLVILADGQELELSATARLGKAKEHAKFSPGLFYYKPSCSININKNCDFCKECVKSCPLNILKEKEGKIVIENIEDCDICEACLDACNKCGKNALDIKASNTDFIFIMESWGQISAKDMFIEAVKALNENLKELEKKADKI